MPYPAGAHVETVRKRAYKDPEQVCAEGAASWVTPTPTLQENDIPINWRKSEKAKMKEVLT
jgi:hypothetical protein